MGEMILVTCEAPRGNVQHINTQRGWGQVMQRDAHLCIFISGELITQEICNLPVRLGVDALLSSATLVNHMGAVRKVSGDSKCQAVGLRGSARRLLQTASSTLALR